MRMRLPPIAARVAAFGSCCRVQLRRFQRAGEVVTRNLSERQRVVGERITAVELDRAQRRRSGAIDRRRRVVRAGRSRLRIPSDTAATASPNRRRWCRGARDRLWRVLPLGRERLQRVQIAQAAIVGVERLLRALRAADGLRIADCAERLRDHGGHFVRDARLDIEEITRRQSVLVAVRPNLARGSGLRETRGGSDDVAGARHRARQDVVRRHFLDVQQAAVRRRRHGVALEGVRVEPAAQIHEDLFGEPVCEVIELGIAHVLERLHQHASGPARGRRPQAIAGAPHERPESHDDDYGDHHDAPLRERFFARRHPGGRPGLSRLADPRVTELRRVAAALEIDAHAVAGTVGRVIFGEPLPQAAGLDPHVGIGVGIEVRRLAKHLGRDRVALEPVAAPRERLLHDESQEAG